MTSAEFAKLIVSIIFGIITAMFWTEGHQDIAIFVMASMLFNIFFVKAEKIEQKKEEEKSKFAEEMKKHKGKF